MANNVNSSTSTPPSRSHKVIAAISAVALIAVIGVGVFIYYQNTLQTCSGAQANYTGSVSDLINSRNDAEAEIKAATDTTANEYVAGFATTKNSNKGASGETLLKNLQTLLNENPVPEAKATCASRADADQLTQQQRAIETKTKEIKIATAQLKDAVTLYVTSAMITDAQAQKQLAQNVETNATANTRAEAEEVIARITPVADTTKTLNDAANKLGAH